MSDPGSEVNAAFNEHLAAENERLEKEIGELRTLLGRPITIQAPEENVLRKIGEYLPKFGELAANTATIAGEMKQERKAVAQRYDQQVRQMGHLIDHLSRVGEALERLLPEPPVGGPEPDDRFIHLEAGALWDGRVCKKYGLVWECHDPGDADPLNPGDQCTVSHKVWSQ